MRVLLLLDIGGSMDPHVQGDGGAVHGCPKAEFRHLEVFYFHNCIYEGLWRDNKPALGPSNPDLGRDPHLWRGLAGDRGRATQRCRPYEVSHPGGANEHWNPEAGEVWLRRIRAQWPYHVWINPVEERGLGLCPVDGA